jgi:DNA polymerase sigma
VSLLGLDCDISLYNPLAISNTKLLFNYSIIDERVRPLAYIVKHWAKSRQINNPLDGTLGSYGFVLCLIHFLQNRPTNPVIPCLQKLPRTWKGESEIMPLDDPISHEFELHPVDNTPVKTYFLEHNRDNSQYFSKFCGKNRESLAELLCGFFAYFAWEFDYKHDIVSIRNHLHHPDGSKCFESTKIYKAENDSWAMHDRLRFFIFIFFCFMFVC